MKRAIAVAAMLLWALAPAALSKETQHTKLNKLNVVALDAQGQPVTGLSSADFQLFQDGKRQDIAFSRFTGGWARQPSQVQASTRTAPVPHGTPLWSSLICLATV